MFSCSCFPSQNTTIPQFLQHQDLVSFIKGVLPPFYSEWNTIHDNATDQILVKVTWDKPDDVAPIVPPSSEANLVFPSSSSELLLPSSSEDVLPPVEHSFPRGTPATIPEYGAKFRAVECMMTEPSFAWRKSIAYSILVE
jgi:hypothetical protein